MLAVEGPRVLTVANFRVRDEPGGRFTVVVDAPIAPSPDEYEFCRRVDWLMDGFTDAGEDGSPAGQLRKAARGDCLQRLHSAASAFASGWAADRAVASTYVIQGRWEAALAPIELTFDVQEIDLDGEPIKRGEQKLASDLRIIVPDLSIGAEKLGFKVDIDRTLTIIKVVLRGRDALGTPRKWQQERHYLEQRRRSHYIHQLAGIARVGLQGREVSLTALAKQSLSSLQEEFVAMEAGSVKNRYLRRLGLRCLVAAAFSVVGYFLCRNATGAGYQLPHALRNFFLLAAGTAVGTWISFSLRRVILTFLDLVALEEDQMDPTNRVLFVLGLSGVVGLLFWTGAVSVGIGEFKSQFAVNGAWALLIGLLLGIAERTMASAVSKRATDFAGAIGGK